MNQPILIEDICVDAINFAMQQNHVPIIRKLILKNPNSDSCNDITLAVSASPAFAAPWSLHIDTLPAESSMEIDGVHPDLSTDYFLSLTEKISGTLKISANCGGRPVGEVRRNISLLAHDQWAGTSIMPEMLAAFVTPNHSRLSQILTGAGRLLENWTGDPSLTAYQTGDKNLVRKQIAAIYSALQRENIMYVQAPPGFEAVGQRIRLCDDLLITKMGNCLDLTLLFAACLEASGLNPLLVCTEGHIFCGCWLENECFPECIQDDPSLLSKRIAQGIHEISLFECTAAVAGKNLSFEQAERLAAGNLQDQPFELLIDVKRSRNSGIRPIPLRREEAGGKPVYEKDALRESLKENSGQAPGTLDIFQKIAHTDKISVTRQQIWERKLLDLSLRNTLLNFRVTKNAVQILSGSLGPLEDALSGGSEFQLMPFPRDLQSTLRSSKIYEVETQTTIQDTLIDAEFEHRRLRTFLKEEELPQRITHLYRQSKLNLEENGANTLFLALGFLRWYESDINQKARYAPVVLLPVDIVRKSALRGYVVRLRDEEPQINITLLEMLRQDFGLTIGGLDPLPLDDSGVDLKGIFNTVRQAVMDKSRWDVEELAFMGIFAFSQFIMWNDIRNRAEELRKNPIVNSLISGKPEWSPQNRFPLPEELDKLFQPADLAIPGSIDSSQLTAVCAAGEGNSFVLHGPPGTGKSQTITNIIANMLFQGKTVLFIAEKMAALSVVERRLKDLGLGPFSLELHSNKTNKKEILRQLEETLEVGQIKRPESYEEEAGRLRRLREKLNGTVKALHSPGKSGVSLYQAISRYEQFRNVPGEITIPSQLLERHTPEMYIDWKEMLDKLTAAADSCKTVRNHPLAALHISDYSMENQQRIAGLIDRRRRELGELKELRNRMKELLRLPEARTREHFRLIGEIAHILGKEDFLPKNLCLSKDLNGLEAKINVLCSAGEERDQKENRLLTDYTDKILNYDAENAELRWRSAAESWLLPKLWKQHKIIGELKPLCKRPEILQGEKIPSVLKEIVEYRKAAETVERHGELLQNLYGHFWNHGRPDFSQIRKLCGQAVSLQKAACGLCSEFTQKKAFDSHLENTYLTDPAAYRNLYGEVLDSYLRLWQKLEETEAALSTAAGIHFKTQTETNSWLEETDAECKQWAEHISELRHWCIWLSVKAEAEKLGLLPAVEALEKGGLHQQELAAVFEKSLYRQTAYAMLESHGELKTFSSSLMETDLKHYRSLCARFEELTRHELAALLSSRIPRYTENAAQSSEIALLKRAIRSGGRGQSIRKLFDSIPNLLPRLCPCMLMSPISVAQYIDPLYPKFDLVIFDEASQLPTCEAVGAIARGDSLIVVGDPKQLPPTSFFAANQVDEDNFEQEDLESILDDCLALSMPQTHLLWHYRSSHESLIAFSNMKYYDGKLLTFPSPNDSKSEVEFIEVDGYYDRGKTKQNEAEAEAVVKEIVRRLQDPVLRRQSMGVVTFSAVQQSLISDRLEEAFARNPLLEELDGRADEPIFVKNLENVQGDERDVILFSIGYGPDRDGKIALNFGPLNRAGGWRRLNVAISRARRKMLIYSTLKPEQIDLSRTGAEGVAGLKAFLEFAANGRSALPVKADSVIIESGEIEKSIACELEKRGHKVRKNIGYSNYRIDIGIVNPDNPDSCILGIVCDGEQYSAAKTARDRNLLQHRVLDSRGWNILRLWAIDWLHSPETELERIEAAIKQAGEKRPPEKEETSGPAAPVLLKNYERVCPKSGKSENLKKYQTCSLPAINAASDAFYEPENNRRIHEQILDVLRAEAPVSYPILTKRITSAWGITRTGSKISARMDALISELRLNRTKTLDTVFLWMPEQDPSLYRAFRIPSGEQEKRSMNQIPREEIAAAAEFVTRNQTGLCEEDLKREIYKLFGFSRIGQNMDAFLGRGIRYAEKKRYILRQNDKIILPDS